MSRPPAPKLDVPPESAVSGSVEPHPTPRLAQRLIAPFLTSVLTGDRLHRSIQYFSTLRTGYPIPIFVYFQLDDPYSFLAVQLLPRIKAAFGNDVAFDLRTTTSPDTLGLGDMERRYFRRDAAVVAPAFGLQFPEFHSAEGDRELEQPSLEVLDAAARAMCWASNSAKMEVDKLLEFAAKVGQQLWSHDSVESRVEAILALPGTNRMIASFDEAVAFVDKNAGLRNASRGYDGHSINALGTWYGGIDRIDHLVADLARVTGRQVDVSIVKPRAELIRIPKFTPRRVDPKKIVVYASFRSPYSAVLLQKLGSFFDKQGGWEWDLKPVPPMVTRGVPLTRNKRIYIAMDCGRVHRVKAIEEGGQPYMQISDPLESWGRPASVYFYLRWHSQGDDDKRKRRALDWMVASTRASFFQGQELGTEAGLAKVAADAGVSPEELSGAMNQDHDAWRAAMKNHTAEMAARGVWGVPTISIEAHDESGHEHTTFWGQDRIWVAEEIIKKVDGHAGSLRL